MKGSISCKKTEDMICGSVCVLYTRKAETFLILNYYKVLFYHKNCIIIIVNHTLRPTKTVKLIPFTIIPLRMAISIFCTIWGSHSSSYECWNLLGLPSHPPEAGFLLSWFSTLKMEVIPSSETSVNIRTTQSYIPEDGNILTRFVLNLLHWMAYYSSDVTKSFQIKKQWIENFEIT
jgi:hypothetical protein